MSIIYAGLDVAKLSLQLQLQEQSHKLPNTAASHQRLLTLLRALPGPAHVTAAVLVAEMPELGTLNRGQAAALAGVAPFARESGKWRTGAGAQSPLHGGSGGQPSNAVLRERHERLRAQGKPGKVALVALMRHLIIHLNALLKTSQTSLAT